MYLASLLDMAQADLRVFDSREEVLLVSAVCTAPKERHGAPEAE
jgi:hypothetical protein